MSGMLEPPSAQDIAELQSFAKNLRTIAANITSLTRKWERERALLRALSEDKT